MKNSMRSISYFLVIVLLSSSIVSGTASAQIEKDAELMFNQANEHFVNGEYKEAITIYDEILEISPNNISTLKMKGIVQSNLEDHSRSLKQFFKVLQHRPNDVFSLILTNNLNDFAFLLTGIKYNNILYSFGIDKPSEENGSNVWITSLQFGHFVVDLSCP